MPKGGKGKPHGPSVLNSDAYEALREKGLPKSAAAAISNKGRTKKGASEMAKKGAKKR